MHGVGNSVWLDILHALVALIDWAFVLSVLLRYRVFLILWMARRLTEGVDFKSQSA